MNKFYFSIGMLIVGVFLGIFYITQKDSIMKSGLFQTPTPILPEQTSGLNFKALTPGPGGETAIEKLKDNLQIKPTFGVEEGVKASYSAVLRTSKGNITLTLFGNQAPNTVKNFIDKAKAGYYKNLAFHRVEEWVIQGGDPKGDGSGGGLMQTELNQLPFVEGSLGVARGGDIRISNDSQFFITKTEASWLNQQYTNFGEVTSGMDVVRRMEKGDKILGITIE